MKKVALSGLLVLLLTLVYGQISLSQTETADRPAEKSGEASQKVVVHLSHFTDDLHRCFMALKLATLMQKSGAEVTLFLDLEGVRLAERRQPLKMTWGSSSTPLSEHYNNFIEAKGKVVLCPHCAQSARIGDMALKRNAVIGTEADLGKMLLSAEKIMDY